MQDTMSRDLMAEFFKDPMNLRITFLMNDIKPVDFSTLGIRDLLKNTQNCDISEKHIRSCINLLKKFDVLRTSRKVSGVKMYIINEESELVQKLFELNETFDNLYSIIMNLPPRPVFVDKKYYQDRKGIPINWTPAKKRRS